MPICIECRYPVSQLYHVLQSRKARTSTATTPLNPSVKSSSASLANALNGSKTTLLAQRNRATAPEPRQSSIGSSDVRLTQCPRCKRFADKYVEHDYVVLFIDLVLVKPQVYRHLLFNRFSHEATALHPSIRRLGTLLLLFDVYLTMIHIESMPRDPSKQSPIFHLNVFIQWGFFVLMCGLASLAQHFTIRWIASLSGLCESPSPADDEEDDDDNDLSSPSSSFGGNVSGVQHGSERMHFSLGGDDASIKPDSSFKSGAATPVTSFIEPPRPPTPNAISTALFVSSCMSLFPILMIVWQPDEVASSTPGSRSATLSTPSLADATASSSSSVSHPSSSSALGSAGSKFLPSFLLAPGRGVGWVRSGVAWAVAVQNLEALRILLGCGYLGAAGLVFAGAMAKWLVRTAILGAVGLSEN